LQEALSSAAWLGIALTVTGVAWVVVERAPDAVQAYLRPWQGIGFGLLAALCQASGSVMSRSALADTAVSPLWSTLIRLVAGVCVLSCWMVVKRQTWAEFKILQSRRFMVVLTAASFASTFLAILLQQTAIKYTAAGIAQSLSATSPLFVIPIALWMGEAVSLRAILGVFIALGGIWLLFQGQ
jgi:drug/metabolite transporter (DMT)-like permease